MRTINFFKYQPRFVLVEVLESSFGFSKGKDSPQWLYYYLEHHSGIHDHRHLELNIDFEIVGKLNLVLASEQMCEGLVDKVASFTTDKEYALFMNYKYEKPIPVSFTCGTAKESLLSRLKAEGNWSTVEPSEPIDPLISDYYANDGEPDSDFIDGLETNYRHQLEEYESALSHYLKPENYLVIKIIEP